jgi:cytidylate kinase
MSQRALMVHGPLADVAERQMRLREVGDAVAERVHHEHEAESAPPAMKPHVCVSRETGAGGEEIAAEVARSLGWHLLDRNLLHNIAEAGAISESLLRVVDEQRWSWLGELFVTWERMGGLNQGGYVLRLGEFVTMVAQNVPVVIVGRGAHCVLPHERGLNVRIIAPRRDRVERVRQSKGCTRAAAESEVDVTDAARNEFVRRYFLCDPADPHLYDLVLNTGGMSLEAATELIVAECRRRFAGA